MEEIVYKLFFLVPPLCIVSYKRHKENSENKKPNWRGNLCVDAKKKVVAVKNHVVKRAVVVHQTLVLKGAVLPQAARASVQQDVLHAI